MEKRYHLTFLSETVEQPIICELIRSIDVLVNIRRANVSHESGFIELGISGSEENIQKAVQFFEKKKVRVDFLGGDVLES